MRRATDSAMWYRVKIANVVRGLGDTIIFLDIRDSPKKIFFVPIAKMEKDGKGFS